MKIMLIEDNASKIKAITLHLKNRGISETDILYAKNMTDFSASFNSMDIGLFIIDFMLPNYDSAPATAQARAILETIVKAGKSDALMLAISSHPEDFPKNRSFYESHGCILADYGNKKEWKSTLDHLLVQLKRNIEFEFVIFSALQEERNPYIYLTPGEQIVRGVIDCYDIKIDDRKGVVVLLPNMGLVNAAVIAALCIERFKPSVVGMSGICGGFENRAKMGQLFISSMVYEYQSGKWYTDGFKQEPYQVNTDPTLIAELNALANTENLIAQLVEGFDGKRPEKEEKPSVGIFTSGSAVIADKEVMDHIEVIHRKVNALDMEIFAIQKAAELSQHKPPCICAKTVVDLCDPNKNDDLHLYGCHISAKFMIKAISHFFSTYAKNT